MYERNAIVLERYFDKLFGYQNENNLKSNYTNYVDLVNSLEKYLKAADSEEKIMKEYEEIANEIKEIQKEQDILYKENIKLQKDRNDLFFEIGESAEDISKKLTKILNDIETNELKIKTNGEEFIERLKEFNEKIEIRTGYEKDNRIIETEYKKNLDKSMDNFSKLNMDIVRNSRKFLSEEVSSYIEEIKAKILKNGEKERVKFDIVAIEKAIQITIDVNKKEFECLDKIFEKMTKLFSEIKNDNVKIDVHKKAINEIKAKLDFLGAEKDYIILFLDNERLNVMSGEKEHQKLMEEACKYLELDLKQIENLYELLQKEINNKSTKKSFKELYNIEYLYELDKKQKEFEFKVSKFNLVGTVINPDYWRIEGIKKIYEVFKNIMEKVFEKDLSEYEVREKEVFEEPIEDKIENLLEEKETKRRGRPKKVEDKKEKEIDIQKSEEESKEDEEEKRRKKLDKILEFINDDSNEKSNIDFQEKVEDGVENIEENIESNKLDYTLDKDDEVVDYKNDDDSLEEDNDFDFDDDDFEDDVDIDSDDELFDEKDEIKEFTINDDNKSQNIEEDDFEDDEDFDFEDSDDFDFDNDDDINFNEEDFNQNMKDENVDKKEKKKKEKKKKTKDTKESKSKNIVKKIKKMSGSNSDIKNMWAD